MTTKPKLVPAAPIPAFIPPRPFDASETLPAPEVEDDGHVTRIGLSSAHEAPAPEQPVMDEAGEYLSGQQSKLDDVQAQRLVLATQQTAREGYYVAEHQRLCARREAELGALAAREGRLARIQSGCEAAIAAAAEF